MVEWKIACLEEQYREAWTLLDEQFACLLDGFFFYRIFETAFFLEV